MREDRQVRMNEFESLFNSQKTSGDNGFGSLNGQNNMLQPAAPSVGGFNSFNRSAPGNAADSFRSAPRPGASASALPDINARVFGHSAAPAPAPEAPRFSAQPPVLPTPKRRL
jgi:hypothetical protein